MGERFDLRPRQFRKWPEARFGRLAASRSGSGRFIGYPLYTIANSTTAPVGAPRMERSRSILLLDVNLLGDCQRIIHLNTKVAHGTFYFRVSKQ